MRKLGLAIVTVLVAGGCGPHLDHPPVIDSVMMPAAATLGTDNLYTLVGQMSYHDDDHPVHTLRVRVPLVNMTYEYPAGDLYIGNIDPLEVKFAAQSPKGPQEYDLSVVDSVGLESAVAVQMVTLQ
jgi:hypothetical protein